MTSVLVTGGAGYIGSHTCKALAEAGLTPVVYDNLVYGHDWAVRWGPFEQGDILDRTRLDEAIATHKPNAVIHFAAFAYVGESVNDPAKYYRNNVDGSRVLLEALRDAGIGSIVFSSSCATYGAPESLPITEGLTQNPINPYGRTKLVVEWMLQDFHRAHDLRFAALRYFNAAGADKDGLIGEDHDPETHLIPRALMALSGQIDELEVFGNDYPTPDGTCIRDYIHVSDLATAHVKAVQRLLSGGEPLAVNLGVGRGFSVKEIIDAAARAAGRPVPHSFKPRRPGDPAELVADVSRAKAELDFTASYQNIDDIVATAWAWHQKHHQR